MQSRSVLHPLLITFGVLVSSANLAAAQSSRSAPAVGGSTASDSVGVHNAAQGFLAAFDSLQFDAFRDYFADDMTMFYPFPQFPDRGNGKAAVEEIFGKFMSAQREARTKAGRPLVQGIAARDLAIQMAGPGAAVVSFHLGAEATPSRRSIVFRKDPAGWKVIHWHASSAPQAPPAPPSR